MSKIMQSIAAEDKSEIASFGLLTPKTSYCFLPKYSRLLSKKSSCRIGTANQTAKSKCLTFKKHKMLKKRSRTSLLLQESVIKYPFQIVILGMIPCNAQTSAFEHTTYGHGTATGRKQLELLPTGSMRKLGTTRYHKERPHQYLDKK